jgi:hypothetical protein
MRPRMFLPSKSSTSSNLPYSSRDSSRTVCLARDSRSEVGSSLPLCLYLSCPLFQEVVNIEREWITRK